jgi:fused signal recognition particle receptor
VELAGHRPSNEQLLLGGLASLALLGLLVVLVGPRLRRRVDAPSKQGSHGRGLATAHRGDGAAALGAVEEAVELDHSTPIEIPVGMAPRSPAREAAALGVGLAKTRGGYVQRLRQLFEGRKELDGRLVDQVEEVLLTADIGAATCAKLLDAVRDELSSKALGDPEAVWRALKRRSTELVTVSAPPVEVTRAKPFVILVVGVNGAGKTTTIGKLAAKFRNAGQTVALAAGDTFRAAAADQLAVWGERAGVVVVRGKEGGDPSSVIFDTVKRAQADGIDVVLADTAGRLHTKSDLMEELQKVRRVTAKAQQGAPHETWLVLDSTNGQNAIAQAQLFKSAMDVTGIVLTKLDGTAKGGVVLGICNELNLPVRYIGIGERAEDLRDFDPLAFIEALYSTTTTSSATSSPLGSAVDSRN